MIKKIKKLKKIAILAIALFAVSFGVKAQSWYVMGIYTFTPPHPTGAFEELHYQAGNVEINGMEYSTIYNQEQGILLGAYRNEDNQVYYCKWNGSAYDDEVLLYDYDLEEGDYFNDEDEHPMQVTAVSTITDDNGIQRKKIEFSFLGLEEETEYWIEGIGSSRGFVNAGNYTPTDDGAVFHLLCYHVGDNLIYVNPTYNACDIDEIDESSAAHDVVVYPNPTNGVVKILNTNDINVSKIEITDLLGRTLISAQNSDAIDVSKLSDGQYLLKIHGESTIVRKLTISK